MLNTLYRPGDRLTAPRGGEPVTVNEVTDKGDVLATHDGRTVIGLWHGDAANPCSGDGSDAVYYEYIAGPNRGIHGWACRECRGIVQTG